MATTFLPGRLPAGARLQVQVAWGADLTALPSTWTWTDITDDVLQDDGAGIQIRVGASSEGQSTAPATCSMTLDNRGGRYSLGGQSPSWPNVRKNTPIRVRVDPGSAGAAYSTRFVGYVDGWPPGWDPSGRRAVVYLAASGILRRLAGNTTPVRSSFRRAVAKGIEAGQVVAYWPCEEQDDAQIIASGIPGAPPMAYTGRPGFGECTAFAGSEPLPTGRISTWTGAVPSYLPTGQVQLRWLLDVPPDGQLATLAEIQCTGSATRWTVRIDPAGSITVAAYSSLAQILSQTIGFGLNGKRGQFGLQLDQTGPSTIHWDVDFIEVGNTISGGFGLDLPGSWTFGSVTQVAMHTDSDDDSRIGLGHVALYDEITNESENQRQLAAYAGENATDTVAGRFVRLAAENGLELELLGDTGSGLATQTTDRMGPQYPEQLVTLLRECETADGGILWDGHAAGLSYTTRRRRMNTTTKMTLSAAAGEVSVEPAHDDQGIRNRVTASRKGGSDATEEDVTGPLGTAVIGTYDSSLTVNTVSEATLPHYARWAVRRGTVDGYRWPQLRLDLARDPGLVASWLAVVLGERIDVTGLSAVRGQLPAGTVSLALDGWAETISQHQWDVTAVCSSWEPWRVARAAAAVGDTSPEVFRADTSGAQLASAAAAGATSLSVATTSGALWTTDADDMPVDVEVAGIRVTVTAIAGAGSPQTFTVAGSTVTKALPAGSRVQLWRPVALAI